MKACKGLFLFCFLGFTVSSCFDPPVFTDSPEISVNKITFKEVEGENTNDSLILYLDFKDGDGDLGLNDDMTTSPYNQSFYFLADGVVVDGKGRLNQVTAIPQTIPAREPNQPEEIAYLITPNGVSGKLATNKTRTKPNYGYLPAYDPNGCAYTSSGFLTMTLETDHLVDGSYNIIDTLIKPPSTAKYFVIDEPIYNVENQNHYNIDVEFWVLDNTGTFKPYDWSALLSCGDFDGRFPFIPHRIGEPIEGTIKYAMLNDAFMRTFSTKRMKLKIRIRDRALNVSNEVETPEFYLPNICTNCD
jgi:hypothetical protein